MNQDKAKENSPLCYLDTPEGEPYREVFKKLRLNHLINHHMDVETQNLGRFIKALMFITEKKI